jgi:hypothetical protein
MRNLVILFLLPLKLFSQDITGLWSGTLYNDTTQTSLRYEVAISENNGKLSGYSYTTFIVDDQARTGVKSIKVVKQKDHFFFEDVELLYNNYPTPPPKGVKQISSVSLLDTDTTRILSGKFITTRTRQYGRQVTGTLRLERKKDLMNAPLITVLNDLGLTNTLSFLPGNNQVPAVATTTKTPPPSVKTAEKKRSNEPVVAVAPKTVNPLEELAKRQVETIETVYFTSDSLRLELYDNGFVDGDSISIIVNGTILLEHQRLTETAITKTIGSTVKPTDSLNIIMYAENLGSIAPNSGLLIIYDGDKRHEVRFSGDLQKNAAIILKRKNK